MKPAFFTYWIVGVDANEGLIAAPLPGLWPGIHPLGYLPQTMLVVDLLHGTAGDGDGRANDDRPAIRAGLFHF